MPEHSPAPNSARGIYGFVVYLLFTTLFVFYVLWAFIPMSQFNSIGITELPNKYFALFVPILVLTATTLFAFCIYPSISYCMTPNINSIYTITDSHAVKRCQFKNSDGVVCDNKINYDPFDSWEVSEVCEDHQNSGFRRISNFCDCVEKDKCMLNSDKNYVEKLSKKESCIQSSADMNLQKVSEILYNDVDLIKKMNSCF